MNDMSAGTSLTPILSSLIKKDAYLLEAFGKGASEDMAACKALLLSQLTSDDDPMSSIKNFPSHPLSLLKQLHAHIRSLTEELRERLDADTLPSQPGREVAPFECANKKRNVLNQSHEDWKAGFDETKFCGKEIPLLVYDRWRKLLHTFFEEKKDQFNITKLPDIYDAAKYE